jgi:hypothetical protein
MPTNSTRIANPFVYGRVLGSQDAACRRSTYELAIEGCRAVQPIELHLGSRTTASTSRHVKGMTP